MSSPTTKPMKWLPSAALGVSVTPSSTAWAYSAFVEISASFAVASDIVGLSVNPGAATGVSYEVDIAIGAAGSEFVLATYRGRIESLGGMVQVVLPTSRGGIKVGDRVSYRLRKSDTDVTAWRVALGYLESNDAVNGTTMNRLLDIPAGALGVAITPSGTAWANSSWVEIMSAANNTFDMAITHLVFNPDAAGEFELEIGVGAAGSETVAFTYAGIAESAEFHFNAPLLIPQRIASGQRISVRLRKSTTTTTNWTAGFNYHKIAEPTTTNSTLSAVATGVVSFVTGLVRGRTISAAIAAVASLIQSYKPYSGPVYEGSAVFTPDFNALTTYTDSYTVGTGNNRLLLVTFLANATSPNVTSMMYGGQSLTRSVLANQQADIEVWYLVNPPSGTNNLVVVVGGVLSTSNLIVSQYSNAQQDSGVIDRTQTNFGSGNSRTINITPQFANEMVIGWVRHNVPGDAITPNAAITERIDQAGDDNALRIWMGDRRALGTSNSPISVNWSTSASDTTGVAISIRGISTTLYNQAMDAVAAGVATLTRSRLYAKIFSVVSTGVVTMTRLLNKYITLPAAAVMVATIAAIDQYYRTLSAAAATVPVLSRLASRYRTLSATMVGVVSLTALKILVRTLSAVLVGITTLARIRQAYRTLSASMTGVPTLARQAARFITLNAAILAVVTLARIRSAYLTLSAAAVGVPTLQRLISRTLSAAMIGVASLGRVKSAPRTLSAAMLGSATLSRILTAYRTLSASTVVTATLSQFRQFFRTLQVTAAMVPTLAKSFVYSRTLSAAALGVATLQVVRYIGRILSAAMAGVGSITRKLNFYRTLSAAMAGNPTITRIRGAYRTLNATVYMATQLYAGIVSYRILSAVATGVATMTRVRTGLRTLTAAAIGIGSLTRQVVRYRTLSAAAIIVTTISRLANRYRTLSATVVVTPVLSRMRNVYRTLSAAAAGVTSLALIKRFSRSLSAVAAAVTSISRVVVRYILLDTAAAVQVSISYSRRVLIELAATAVGVVYITQFIIGAVIKRSVRLVITMRRRSLVQVTMSMASKLLVAFDPKPASPNQVQVTVSKPTTIPVIIKKQTPATSVNIKVEMEGEPTDD